MFEENNYTPSDADLLRQTRMRADSVVETVDGRFNIPAGEEVGELAKYKLRRLAVMGMDLKLLKPYDVIEAPIEQQEAYLAGVYDAARFVVRQVRSGGIA
jgi:hypothetical protein